MQEVRGSIPLGSTKSSELHSYALGNNSKRGNRDDTPTTHTCGPSCRIQSKTSKCSFQRALYPQHADQKARSRFHQGRRPQSHRSDPRSGRQIGRREVPTDCSSRHADHPEVDPRGAGRVGTIRAPRSEKYLQSPANAQARRWPRSPNSRRRMGCTVACCRRNYAKNHGVSDRDGDAPWRTVRVAVAHGSSSTGGSSPCPAKSPRRGAGGAYRLSPAARDVLRDHLPAEQVVTTIGTVFNLTSSALGQRWARVREKASEECSSVASLHFHDFRHECLSRLAQKGWTLPKLRVMSGHADFPNATAVHKSAGR